jgi:hypothetical protein
VGRRRAEQIAAEPIAPPLAEPTFPRLKCRAVGCDRIATEGSLCSGHKRARKLTTTIQDALLEFFTTGNAIVPASPNDKNVVAAGECFEAGLGLLIQIVLGNDVVFAEKPFVADMGFYGERGSLPRWRIQFLWRIADESELESESEELVNS